MGKIDKKKKNSLSKPFKRQAPVTKDQGKKSESKITGIKSNGKIISKKVKRQQKKSALITKLTESKEAKKKLQIAKVKAQTAIVGNMDPLFDALTEIAVKDSPLLSKEKQKRNKTDVSDRKNKHPTEKRRLKSNFEDIRLFKTVTKHPKFTYNPIHAITDHVKYLILMEEDEQTI